MNANIYPLPPVLLHNPYLDCLYDALAACAPEYSVRRTRPVWRGVAQLLTTRGPRIWHVHFFDELVQARAAWQSWARVWAFLAGVTLVRATGARIVWTAHNLEPHEVRHAASARAAYTGLARRADAVIVHSAAAGRALVERYGAPRRLVVIPHGNWAGRGGPVQTRAAARAALGWAPDAWVALGIGVLRPYKGFEDLLDAFQAAALPRAELVIAGRAQDPAYYAGLVARAAACPGARIVPGYLEEAALATYMAAADVVVLAHHKLLTSGVLLWPLSYGAPVIAPAFAPITEVLTDGVSGFLYAPGDGAGLRAALQRAHAHTALATLGQAGQAAIAAWTWPAVAARTAALYAEVLQGSVKHDE